MHVLTNCTITNVEKGPSGASSYGVWQIHNIWINNEEQKYSYFEKDGYIPVVGTMLAVMEYEVQQKGDYTNFTVKKMTLAKPTAPPVVATAPAAVPVPAAQPALVAQPVQLIPVVKPEPVPTRELMMCVAYAKDIMIQQIVMDHALSNTNLETLMRMVGEAGLALLDQLKAGKRAAKVAESVPVPTSVKQPVNSNPAPPVLANKDVPF